MVVTQNDRAPRNPGPSWGFAFLIWADRRLPPRLFRIALRLGTWVALPFMPRQRVASREYLTAVFGRQPRQREVWRHFFAFTEFLILRLRVARGVSQPCRLEPVDGPDFATLRASAEPALFGTFHYGHSDLLGFFLARGDRPVAMVRLRVGNSDDTRLLGRLFGDSVRFIWVNDPGNLLFALKDAIEAGESLALQCDRLEHVARAESFQFLGAARLFPFTIYHLAVLFNRPVMFCVGVPGAAGETVVRSSPLFRPDTRSSREENLRIARGHFQAVLEQLESLIRQEPMRWFNFLPLNPVAPSPRARAA